MTYLGLAEGSIQLVPDGTLFLHIAVIILMVYVLNTTLFRPINRILAERERRTRDQSGEASGILRDIDASLSQYDESLRAARAAGYSLLEQGRGVALRERQGHLVEVRQEVERALEEEKELIRVQTQQARESLGRDARQIAADIGAQILHRPVDGGTASDTRA